MEVVDRLSTEADDWVTATLAVDLIAKCTIEHGIDGTVVGGDDLLACGAGPQLDDDLGG